MPTPHHELLTWVQQFKADGQQKLLDTPEQKAAARVKAVRQLSQKKIEQQTELKKIPLIGGRLAKKIGVLFDAVIGVVNAYIDKPNDVKALESTLDVFRKELHDLLDLPGVSSLVVGKLKENRIENVSTNALEGVVDYVLALFTADSPEKNGVEWLLPVVSALFAVFQYRETQFGCEGDRLELAQQQLTQLETSLKTALNVTRKGYSVGHFLKDNLSALKQSPYHESVKWIGLLVPTEPTIEPLLAPFLDDMYALFALSDDAHSSIEAVLARIDSFEQKTLKFLIKEEGASLLKSIAARLDEDKSQRLNQLSACQHSIAPVLRENIEAHYKKHADSLISSALLEGVEPVVFQDVLFQPHAFDESLPLAEALSRYQDSYEQFKRRVAILSEVKSRFTGDDAEQFLPLLLSIPASHCDGLLKILQVLMATPHGFDLFTIYSKLHAVVLEYDVKETEIRFEEALQVLTNYMQNTAVTEHSIDELMPLFKAKIARGDLLPPSLLAQWQTDFPEVKQETFTTLSGQLINILLQYPDQKEQILQSVQLYLSHVQDGVDALLMILHATVLTLYLPLLVNFSNYSSIQQVGLVRMIAASKTMQLTQEECAQLFSQCATLSTLFLFQPYPSKARLLAGIESVEQLEQNPTGREQHALEAPSRFAVKALYTKQPNETVSESCATVWDALQLQKYAYANLSRLELYNKLQESLLPVQGQEEQLQWLALVDAMLSRTTGESLSKKQILAFLGADMHPDRVRLELDPTIKTPHFIAVLAAWNYFQTGAVDVFCESEASVKSALETQGLQHFYALIGIPLRVSYVRDDARVVTYTTLEAKKEVESKQFKVVSGKHGHEKTACIIESCHEALLHGGHSTTIHPLAQIEGYDRVVGLSSESVSIEASLRFISCFGTAGFNVSLDPADKPRDVGIVQQPIISEVDYDAAVMQTGVLQFFDEAAGFLMQFSQVDKQLNLQTWLATERQTLITSMLDAWQALKTAPVKDKQMTTQDRAILALNAYPNVLLTAWQKVSNALMQRGTQDLVSLDVHHQHKLNWLLVEVSKEFDDLLHETSRLDEESEQVKNQTQALWMRENLTDLTAKLQWVKKGWASFRFWFTRACVRNAARELSTLVDALQSGKLSTDNKQSFYDRIQFYAEKLERKWWLFPWDYALRNKIVFAQHWLFDQIATQTPKLKRVASSEEPPTPPYIANGPSVFKATWKTALCREKDALTAQRDACDYFSTTPVDAWDMARYNELPPALQLQLKQVYALREFRVAEIIADLPVSLGALQTDLEKKREAFSAQYFKIHRDIVGKKSELEALKKKITFTSLNDEYQAQKKWVKRQEQELLKLESRMSECDTQLQKLYLYKTDQEALQKEQLQVVNDAHGALFQERKHHYNTAWSVFQDQLEEVKTEVQDRLSILSDQAREVETLVRPGVYG
ncbi:MAG: hypothetical protein NTW08_06105 [Gammaproteobacteria bacterium]|nr:hypothetical protein [Gammaproteobacteria bacterium]